MVRKSLILAALVAVASPLTAQEEWVWTSDRPDGTAPLGVFGTETLDAGQITVEYQWIQRNYQGVWRDKDSLSLAVTLSQYEVAPISLADIRHSVEVAFGVFDDLTVRARGEFAFMEREQLGQTGEYRINTVTGLGDIYADLTYNVIRSGPWRLDVTAGAVAPIGKSRTYVQNPVTGVDEVTPYDMRPGAGSIGVYGGASGQIQNEFGSVGGQFKFRTYLYDNSPGFTVGDRYEANGWAAYRINEMFSVSGGVRWEKWGRIDGADELLIGLEMEDPMNDGLFLSGIRASMPLGLNFVAPEGSVISGHRISFETVYPLHHDYDGAQIGLDWGINLGYQVPFF
jgi:hypothetical protein